MNWRERISLETVVSQPMACIRGTQIPVAAILEELAQGAGREDILNRHPSLAPEDIQAALAYASELARDAIIPGSAYPGARFLRHFCT